MAVLGAKLAPSKLIFHPYSDAATSTGVNGLLLSQSHALTLSLSTSYYRQAAPDPAG